MNISTNSNILNKIIDIENDIQNYIGKALANVSMLDSYSIYSLLVQYDNIVYLQQQLLTYQSDSFSEILEDQNSYQSCGHLTIESVACVSRCLTQQFIQQPFYSSKLRVVKNHHLVKKANRSVLRNNFIVRFNQFATKNPHQFEIFGSNLQINFAKVMLPDAFQDLVRYKQNLDSAICFNGRFNKQVEIISAKFKKIWLDHELLFIAGFQQEFCELTPTFHQQLLYFLATEGCNISLSAQQLLLCENGHVQIRHANRQCPYCRGCITTKIHRITDDIFV